MNDRWTTSEKLATAVYALGVVAMFAAGFLIDPAFILAAPLWMAAFFLYVVWSD